jgi:glycosyltransferase involved in cell wall biosynthesis
MRVTVITPTGSDARALAQTIDSVLAQELHELEYILLDDGSSAEVQVLLGKYSGDARFRRKIRAGGSGESIDAAALASGDMVCQIAPGEALLPGAALAAAKALDEHPDATAAYFDWALVDANEFHVRTIRMTGSGMEEGPSAGPGVFYRGRGLAAPARSKFVHVPRVLATRWHSLAAPFAAVVRPVAAAPPATVRWKAALDALLAQRTQLADTRALQWLLGAMIHIHRWRSRVQLVDRVKFYGGTARFAVCTRYVPPLSSGQSVVLGRLLGGLPKDAYCIVSLPLNPGKTEENFIEPLPAKRKLLPAETGLRPIGGLPEFSRRLTMLYQVWQRGRNIRGGTEQRVGGHYCRVQW